MLYHFLVPLADQFSVFNVFRYLTFRTGGAVMTALIVSFIFGPVLIEVLKAHQRGGQPIRVDDPETHLLTKQGTPTMGGVLILLALSVATTSKTQALRKENRKEDGSRCPRWKQRNICFCIFTTFVQN